ncbi:MAG: response regulator [Pyrinomonadaceae bacterium]
MDRKKVLIVDDDENDIQDSKEAVERCGFEVYTARDVASARRLAEEMWEHLDLLILDMQLRDPQAPYTTGADIAIEFRRKKDSFPPESLIYSSKNEIDYYRLALKLGAAAYILKEQSSSLSVLEQHVRVLTLRRALNGENPEVATEVARIAAHSRSQSEAILTFCRRILSKEFEACLGAPFVILFTEEDATRNCADNAGLPPGSSTFYHTLQALAHGRGNVTEPFILEAGELGTAPDPETARLYEKLDRAAFLPLTLSGDKRLSIGILQEKSSDAALKPADARTLCTVLSQYLRPTVLENVISIWSQWTELHATRNSTAKLCLSVGQEIKDSVESEEFGQLEELADDLNDTGQYLTRIGSQQWHDEGEPVSVKAALASAWELITHREEELAAQGSGEPALTIDLRGGDCNVHALSSDVDIILSRLLQWFIYRGKFVPRGVPPALRIECEEADGWANITFEDDSQRLPKKLREELFAPFTQAISTPFAEIERASRTGKEPPTSGRYLPLYLAKMLVEGRYRGQLEDHSDEIIAHDYGHRIVMQFPISSEVN